MAAETALSADESNLLLAAMLKAQADGDEDAVTALAGMADDPARFREAADAAGTADDTNDEPAEKKTLPQVPRLETRPGPRFGKK